MSSIFQVSGDSFVDGQSPGFAGGTGILIGDGYALTAGHVIFEYDRSHQSPLTISHITLGGNSLPSWGDLHAYRNSYLGLAQVAQSQGYGQQNGDIEAEMVSIDTVVIQHSGTVNN